MGDLVSILNAAASSMSAQRGVTATASHNVSNANTPGYSRQTAVLQALEPADQVGGVYFGRGAGIETVVQARDRFLEAQMPRSLASAAQSSAESDALQAYHGLDPAASGGLGDALAGFYSALRALAQNPGEAGHRQVFLGAARGLARSFNATSTGIESARTALDVQARGLISQINQEAKAVADLNGQVQAASGGGQPPNDLLDLRQRHLDKLAELTGGTPVATAEGYVNVALQGGLSLVAGTHAGTLSVAPDPANGNHLAVSLTFADGVGQATLGARDLGGSLAGTLAARDGALLRSAGAVDQLAFDLAGAVNAVHAQGFGLDGSTGLALFDTGGAVAGAAAHLAVAVTDPAQLATAAAPGAPGDSGNANALLATEAQPLAGGQDAQTRLSTTISEFGSAAEAAKATRAQDAAVKGQLSAMRESASGVSIDEEMVIMQAAQRAYEAIAKVIQTVDQMMQTLLTIKS